MKSSRCCQISCINSYESNLCRTVWQQGAWVKDKTSIQCVCKISGVNIILPQGITSGNQLEPSLFDVLKELQRTLSHDKTPSYTKLLYAQRKPYLGKSVKWWSCVWLNVVYLTPPTSIMWILLVYKLFIIIFKWSSDHSLNTTNMRVHTEFKLF